jgi:hypothetical protein
MLKFGPPPLPPAGGGAASVVSGENMNRGQEKRENMKEKGRKAKRAIEVEREK